ncbi:MAG: leucine-rich repeat domain-containing protein [Bullifex sp.]|nr:leucine-rich repeat domain-containing protein [Bullifex sp.]
MKEKSAILAVYDGDMKNVVIPAGTRMIKGEEIAFGTEFEEEDERIWHRRVRAPFSRNNTIETVTMDDGVTVIGPKAFEHCANLRSIRLSANLEVICLSAFLGCKSLKEIHLPHSLKRVDDWAFGLCCFDKAFYDGTLLEADKVLQYGSDFCTKVLVTNDAIVNFQSDKYYLDDFYFPGTGKEWIRGYYNHWLNWRARRIHTSDGKLIENS